MADVADGDHSNAITSECCDPFGHRLHNADDSCHQRLVHIQITLIFSQVALAMRLIEYAPLRSVQGKRVRQGLEHLIAVLRSIAMPTERRER